jgi:Kef-type K+ transport system membrane component KefB
MGGRFSEAARGPKGAALEQFSRATSSIKVCDVGRPLSFLAQITPQLAVTDWAGALGRLLLQLAVIVLATRTVGPLFRRAGLPAVVGEIAAGICLGPSVLGGLWPGAFGFIFAADSLGRLRGLSQVGVVVFMFLVGMELETGGMPSRGRAAVLISQCGIVVPFLLGLTSAYFLYPEYATVGARFIPFALFLGIALSITAFPVLVRILRERAMMKTPLGIMAVACAAAGDATAWTVLALIVALARAQGLAASLLNFGWLALFVVSMLGPVRRRLPGWLGAARWEDGKPSPAALAAVFIFAAASALVTEFLGIHALFGAFLAGAIMPRRTGFRESLAGLEKFTALVLLPLFFAFSGLRTHLGLLQGAGGWWVCLGLVVVATIGKIGSTLVAARWQGMGWGDAFALGALMNTRGLMELIALNVGYDLGILSQPIFAALVLMALVTTFLTGPLLDLGGRFRRPV